MKNLALIAAVGYNNELGLDNRLLWHIPEDLTFYKKMTMGKNIIMGRNTFESMPVNALKGRNPIVLSSKDIDRYADVICYNNIENTTFFSFSKFSFSKFLFFIAICANAQIQVSNVLASPVK